MASPAKKKKRTDKELDQPAGVKKRSNEERSVAADASQAFYKLKEEDTWEEINPSAPTASPSRGRQRDPLLQRILHRAAQCCGGGLAATVLELEPANRRPKRLDRGARGEGRGQPGLGIATVKVHGGEARLRARQGVCPLERGCGNHLYEDGNVQVSLGHRRDKEFLKEAIA